MQLKKIVSFTNGVRHQIKIQKNLLSKYNSVIKNLLIRRMSLGGRNNTGRITIRHKGAGCKKKSHSIYSPKYSYALILSVMYNANSNAFVSLNFDLKKKIFFKSITVKNAHTGCLLEARDSLKDFKLGYRSLISNLPSGAIINSISKNAKIVFAKSAGSFCQIIEKKKSKVKIKLPSGKLVYISNKEYATLGYISNAINKLTVIGKAGRNRLSGIRPSVRGIAMNPVDHPHGGKSNKGMPQVTPWGLPTKNKPTVKKKYE